MIDTARFGVLYRVRWLWLCAVVFVSVLRGGLLVAQQDVPLVAKNDAPTMLRVYTNLVQVPVLVLGKNSTRLKESLDASQFSVSIDGGPRFHAVHVRMEGDDPISLSILLDVHGEATKLMPEIDEAIAGLAPDLLQAQDRVSVFALDCSLVQGMNDMPADAASLKPGVDAALRSWTTRMQDKHAERCKQTMHLRDALAEVMGELGKLPGRRVMLVVTDGTDFESKATWRSLEDYAQTMGVAVFGVKYFGRVVTWDGLDRRTTVMGSIYQRGTEDPFESFCELSGGLVMSQPTAFLWDNLAWFTTMLRERYIVEYPRAVNATAGFHSLEVRVDKEDSLIIRPTGVSMSIPDAAVLADPTTISVNPANAPVQGKQQRLNSR